MTNSWTPCGSAWRAGDIGFSRGSGLLDWAIRTGEERRYGKGSPYAWANHTWMHIDSLGTIIEAQGSGVVIAKMRDQHGDPEAFSIWRPNYRDLRSTGVAVNAMYSLLGRKYGYATIVCEAIAFLTGTKLRFGMSGQYICSGAVSHALVESGIDMGDDSDFNSPADVLRAAATYGWTHVTGVNLDLSDTTKL